MKILFTCAYFPPEKAASIYLTENLVEDLSRQGNKVAVFTPSPTRGIDDKTRESYLKRPLETLCDGNATIRRFPLYKEGRNPIGRALRYFICTLQHTYYALKERYDILFLDSTPPTQGIIGAVVKALRHKKVVYNLQDIFPDSLVSTGLAKKDSILWKIGRAIENMTYCNADKIIVISEDFKRNIAAKGVPEDKIEVVYNWVDEKSVVPVQRKDNPLFEEFGLNRSDFFVVYAGNLGSAQNIDIILHAADKTRDVADLKYLIFGNEEQAAEYRSKAESMRLTNLRFLPIQPYERVSFVYSLGNAAIVSCKKGFGQIAMPSKTWSIMSAGTAVIASFDGGGDLQNIIESNRAGLFTQAESTDEFTDAIMRLHENPNECEAMGKRGREFIIRNLTREIGTSRYSEIFTSLYKNRNA